MLYEIASFLAMTRNFLPQHFTSPFPLHPAPALNTFPHATHKTVVSYPSNCGTIPIAFVHNINASHLCIWLIELMKQH